MKKIRFNLENLDRRDALSGSAPFVYMYENGTVMAHCPDEDVLSDDILQSRTFRWPIDGGVDCVRLKEILLVIQPEFQALLDGHKVAWDGNAFQGSLNGRALEAMEQIAYVLASVPEFKLDDGRAEIPPTT